MIKALVFDFFGVIRKGGRIDQEMLDLVLVLRKQYKTAILSNVIDLDKYMDPELAKSYFDVVAASDRIGHAKPEKKPTSTCSTSSAYLLMRQS